MIKKEKRDGQGKVMSPTVRSIKQSLANNKTILLKKSASINGTCHSLSLLPDLPANS
jgi:hypothetical protein